jgi:hypothetical protein
LTHISKFGATATLENAKGISQENELVCLFLLTGEKYLVVGNDGSLSLITPILRD